VNSTTTQPAAVGKARHAGTGTEARAAPGHRPCTHRSSSISSWHVALLSAAEELGMSSFYWHTLIITTFRETAT
jgi:hypothetical protein